MTTKTALMMTSRTMIAMMMGMAVAMKKELVTPR